VESYQVISGFSDIKSELRDKAKIKKPLSEIQLWFTVDRGVLCVHDFSEHEKCIVLAIYSEKKTSWTVFLKKVSGRRLVMWVLQYPPGRIGTEFNKLNDLYGFLPGGGRY
jgi:hypothetical protein